MNALRTGWLERDEQDDRLAQRRPAPGKAALTDRLPRGAGRGSGRDEASGAGELEGWSSGARSAPAVQADGGPARFDDPFAVHLAAERGVQAGATTLPHLAAIQRSFGHHDVSGIRAHVGGAAAEAAAQIGATAYATGDAVAFSASPDLRQAAHEAAHVVQQRGGVRLDGGVGQRGDLYEQHAEAVAALVMRGESAETLLDEHAHRGSGGGAAVQRLDSHEIVGDTMSATRDRRGGGLDARSQRRVIERIAELEGRDPVAAGEAFEAMAPEARSTELREAVTRFQRRPDGRALIEEIEADNATRAPDGESALYGERSEAARIEDFGADRDGDARARATGRAAYTEGAVAANDVTLQALANAWPQRMFGRLLTQEQAYHLLRALVTARGLPFDPSGVNVIGMRAFQGETHDNGEGEAPAAPVEEVALAGPEGGAAATEEASPRRRPRRPRRPRREDPSRRAGRRIFTRHNRYDDTLYTLSKRDGLHLVQTTRGTVDPGNGATSEVASRFQVASDQQWDYDGNPAARSIKYDRPMYGLPERSDVRFGRSLDEPAERAMAAPRDGLGRVIRRPHGEVERDVSADGEARRVSALHSGSRGGVTGEETSADSTGCTVVHGDWYAHFNEGLRRADAARRDAHAGEAGAPFTYSLLDPRDFPPEELEALIERVAQGTGGEAGVAGEDEEAAADATGAPSEAEAATRSAPASAAPSTPPVQRDGGVGQRGDGYEQHAEAVAAQVVRGESAEPLLDAMAPASREDRASTTAPASSAAAVQRDGEVCEGPAVDATAPAGRSGALDAPLCAADGESEAEAAAVEAIRATLPEVAAAEPPLRDYRALREEMRARYEIPAGGWHDVRRADGRDRPIDLSLGLRQLIERVQADPGAVAHIRETLDLFYEDPDPRSRLSPGEIDVSLVLAIAMRESGPRQWERLLSSRDERVVTAGPDTHRDGVGGLDYVGGRTAVHRPEDPRGTTTDLFPSAIRDEVTPVQDDAALRARLVPGRTRANPAELPERDLLAAYIVEVRFRTQLFERRFRAAADDFLTAEQTEQLWGTLDPDARRAWVQAAFGSALDTLLHTALRRFRAAMRGDGGFAGALADDAVNLRSIAGEDAVIDAAGLSGHRTRVTAAEAAMLDESLPAELRFYAGADHAAAMCVLPEATSCEPAAPRDAE